ncbi:MAG TPA: DUF5989 family protein [Planctomycetota bacterium]|jgi:hypothetical protein|nr:DUF5989 family protein [Planctomycetota bacterium]
MKAINVLLALLVSLAVAAGVLEIGLRLLGMGPQPTINKFDKDLGWVKTPNSVAHRKTGEYDVTFKINSLGLRDDEMTSPAKPAGTFRVLALGDSFVQGYTVDRENLFADILEKWWQAEGRKVDVINAGTEGYSTDQEVVWFQERGREYQPDLVLLFPYENDLYWNAKTHYDRYPKPRFNPSGEAEMRVLQDPGPPSVVDRWALGRFLKTVFSHHDLWSPAGGHPLPMEWVAYFRTDPEPMREVKERTHGALLALQRSCKDVGAALCVVPIPNKAAIEPTAKKTLESQVGVDTGSWSPDVPVETFLALCKDLGIPAIDPRDALRADVPKVRDGHLYYQKDWHLNAEGNRTLARFVHDQLDTSGAFPAAFASTRKAELPIPPDAPPSYGPVKLFAFLWALLSISWILTYRKDPAWQAPLKVAVMLGLVFTIALGGGWLLGQLPAAWSSKIAVLFVLGLLGFIVWKLGRRIGTIVELFICFVGRGHWYLIPLVVVLLSVGSLLVVAASSPLIAPFIYTLF